MEQEPILQMESDRMLLQDMHSTSHSWSHPNKHERQNRFNPDNEGELVWYTDRSKTNRRHWFWCVWMGLEKGHSFSLGLHTTTFQDEIRAIKGCVM